MRIMFIWPGLYLGWNCLGKGFEQSAINHGLSSISAVLKNWGHDCFLLDMRSLNGWEHYEKIISEQVFDVALIGFYSVDEKFAAGAIERLKKMYPEKPVIAGGVHITFNQIESFSKADCVVWGEGDRIAADLILQIEKGISIPKKVIAETVTDLDGLPFLDRSLFNSAIEQQHPLFPLLPQPFYTINFSRGCAFSCAFCLESKNYLWKKYRVRSPENCIEELKILKDAGSLMIHDDHFPTGDWIYRFIELWDMEIARRIPFWCQIRADWIVRHQDAIPDMARIGMTWVSLGIEGSQRMLDFYNKKLKTETIIEASRILHANQVNIFGNYILGAPTETEADLKELGEMLSQIRPQYHSPSTYTSYPGSLLYDFIAENNLWAGPIDDPNSHYSTTRWPYERKISGIDYEKINQLRSEWTSKYKSDLLIYGK